MRFWIGDWRIQMFDVGGQRSERKKWIRCFEREVWRKDVVPPGRVGGDLAGGKNGDEDEGTLVLGFLTNRRSPQTQQRAKGGSSGEGGVYNAQGGLRPFRIVFSEKSQAFV
ncbi:hypothetical protein B0H16DRAFT_1567336 [Mycena metata]|uniref:Uncharacterized protein n=1 Tax=Mycena metata TaxID=1033252 RepID=A0AAD7IDJ7_9AGAR|nr:hypothetical protein B0H16DRAFT_1567336 [Mycena metata]